VEAFTILMTDVNNVVFVQNLCNKRERVINWYKVAWVEVT